MNPSICSSIALLGLAVMVMATFLVSDAAVAINAIPWARWL
jgi:hypothetical protein